MWFNKHISVSLDQSGEFQCWWQVGFPAVENGGVFVDDGEDALGVGLVDG